MAEIGLRTVESLPEDWPVVRLAAILRANLYELRARYGLDDVALFGSYVRNEQRPDSDLDLLVTLSRRLSLFDLIGLENDLSDMLGVSVEVALRDNLQPRIGRYILREAVAL